MLNQLVVRPRGRVVGSDHPAMQAFWALIGLSPSLASRSTVDLAWVELV